MTKTAIRKTVEDHLASVGLGPESWMWNRSELVIAAGNALRRISLKSGMSKRDVNYALGRIAGIAEMIVKSSPAPEVA